MNQKRDHCAGCFVAVDFSGPAWLIADTLSNHVGEQTMRAFQIALFIFGATAVVASAFFIGKGMGDVLWGTGIAALVSDVVCIQLWPTRTRPEANARQGVE
jgi:hypothetical protein